MEWTHHLGTDEYLLRNGPISNFIQFAYFNKNHCDCRISTLMMVMPQKKRRKLSIKMLYIKFISIYQQREACTA